MSRFRIHLLKNYFQGQTWRLIYGRPELIGPLINRGFYQWVKTDLYAEVMERVDDNFNFLPHSSVPENVHWLSAFVNDKMMDITPASDPDCRGMKRFYIGFEQDFDCQEVNCLYHHTWYFHCKKFDIDDETVQGSNDCGCLEFEFEAWLESFLTLRFPAIDFDYESLMNGNTVPRLRITHTF